MKSTDRYLRIDKHSRGKLKCYYTEQKLVHHDPPLEIESVNGLVTKIHTTAERDPNGYLYSLASYPTKMLPENLPPEFLGCTIFGRDGYIDTSRVTDISYKPNNFVNHLFRDDALYIKYGGKLHVDYDSDWDMEYVSNYDLILDGWDIIAAVAYLEKFSTIDCTDVLCAIKTKVDSYKTNYPDEPDAISLDKFNEYLERYRSDARMAMKGVNWCEIRKAHLDSFKEKFNINKSNEASNGEDN